MIPSEVTVVIDKREQTPLLFPDWIRVQVDRSGEEQMVDIKQTVKVMPAGDYCLEGYDDLVIFETKRTLRELYNNVCTKDWGREARALKRLSEGCKYPHLVFELSPAELFQKNIHVPRPHLVFDRWMQVVARFHLHLMIVGGARQPRQRRALGEQLVRLALSYIHNPDNPMDTPWDEGLREFMWREAPNWITQGDES